MTRPENTQESVFCYKLRLLIANLLYNLLLKQWNQWTSSWYIDLYLFTSKTKTANLH